MPLASGNFESGAQVEVSQLLYSAPEVLISAAIKLIASTQPRYRMKSYYRGRTETLNTKPVYLSILAVRGFSSLREEPLGLET